MMASRHSMLWIFLALLSSLLLVMSCSSDGGGGNDDDDDTGDDDTGDDDDGPEASGECGPEGCDIEVTDPDSSLYGSYVSVPEGALAENVQITISVSDSPEAVPQYTSRGSTEVELGPEGLGFTLPVTIGVNRMDSSPDTASAVFWRNPVLGAWQSLIPVSSERNADKGVISAWTTHFSRVAILNGSEQPPQRWDTGFSPNPDAFSIPNGVAWWEWFEGTGGHCLGMAAFSKWFYDYRSSQETCPPLQESYSNSSQDSIARRAHRQAPNRFRDIGVMLEDHWGTTLDLDPPAAYEHMKLALIAENRPVFVVVGNSEGPGHAAVAYSYDETDGTKVIYLYDPNDPGEECALELESDGSWWYGHCSFGNGYTRFAGMSEPGLIYPSFYEELYEQFPCSQSRPPEAPTNLQAEAISDTQIDLEWEDRSNNEDGFTIERRTGGGSWLQIADLGSEVESYSNHGLECETQYEYRVVAYNGNGTSGYSDTASARTKDCPLEAPVAPTNLVADAVSDTRIDLEWNDNSNNESGFKIERRLTAGGTWSQIAIVGQGQETYLDSPLECDTQYSYQVRAYNGAGDSPYSNTDGATTDDCPPEGACCDGETCSISTEASCTGNWFGAGTNCTPNPCLRGACCNGQSCAETIEDECASDWLGAESDCTPNPCLDGACCYGEACIDTREDECPEDWLGTGTDCSPNPCRTGACCDGAICSMEREESCVGEWVGTGADCTPNPCDIPDEILIPAGTFAMGCEPDDLSGCCDPDEFPRHEVSVPAFFIDTYEVTNQLYVGFLNNHNPDNDCAGYDCILLDPVDVPIYESGGTWNVEPEFAERPVNSVSWYGASEYCNTIGKRLPSEAEWEKAAKGVVEHFIYPYGDLWTEEAANWYYSGDPYDNSPTPIGYYDGSDHGGTYQTESGVSPYGVHDMAGNVWEWCEDDYHYSYEDAPADGSPWIDTPRSSLRVNRGGSYSNFFCELRTSEKHPQVPLGSNYFDTGFRCARGTAPIGACCEGASCSLTDETNCSGEWLGEGIACDPNPCICSWSGAEIVDTSGDVGYGLEMAILESTPILTYTEYELYENRALRFAYAEGNVWWVNVVADTVYPYIAAVDVDSSNGLAHLAYKDSDSSKAITIDYAVGFGDTWTITYPSTSIRPDQVRMRLDSTGYAHIVYVDAYNDEIGHVYNAPSGWQNEQIVDYTLSSSFITVLLEIGNDNTLHVVYAISDDIDAVFYAYKDENTWNLEQVSGEYTANRDMAICLNSENEPSVLIEDGTNERVILASKTGGNWEEDVVLQGTVGDIACIYGPGNVLSIAYSEPTNNGYDSFHYLTNSTGFWVDEVIDNTGSEGHFAYLDVGVGTDGLVHVAYMKHRYNGDAEVLHQSCSIE